MIVKNEEKFLEQCLLSVQGLVDEIVIVDTGSTDKTKDIALRVTSKVYNFEWCDDFAAARNESLKYASGDWILVLDADETISHFDFTLIKETLCSTLAAGFFLPIRNYINNSSLTDWVSAVGDNYIESKVASGWKEILRLRLFKNDSIVKFEGIIHELPDKTVERIGKIATLNVPIHHFGHLTENKRPNKREMYELLSKKKAINNPNFISFYELGNVFWRNGNLEKALNAYQQAVEDKNFFEGWFMIGNLNLLKKDFGKAKEALLKAQLLNNKSAEVYLGLGLIFVNEKDYTKAINFFIESIVISPKNPVAHYNLGLCFNIIGENNKAYLAIKNAIELDPKYKDLVEFAS